MTLRFRRTLLLALAALVIGGAVTTWALTSGERTTRRLAARSIRSAVGPPAPKSVDEFRPATEESELPGTSDMDVPDAGALADPPVLERPEKPRGLRNVSFVMLLGMDRTKRKVTGRTDTIMLVAFRHRDGKVAAVSVPRDLWIEIPDLRPARINAVVRIGDLEYGKGKGIPLLKQVIEREFGIKIDHHAAIELDAFVELVDSLGGIDVEVACPIKDCFWLDGPDQPCVPLDLPAGSTHMDGITAHKFVRSRHGTGERDRRRRQQAVLLAFEQRVRDEGLVGLSRLWQIAEPHVDTDLEWDSAAYYASFALENEPGDVRGFSIRRPMTRKHVTEDAKHVLLLNRDEFDAALDDLFDDPLPALRARKKCPEPDAALNYKAKRKK